MAADDESIANRLEPLEQTRDETRLYRTHAKFGSLFLKTLKSWQ